MPEVVSNESSADLAGATSNRGFSWDSVGDSALLELIQRAPTMSLGAGCPCRQTAERVELWAQRSQPKPLVLAGLWLLAGELDKSHAISQQYESADGAVWHGIMHRREGDFWNAKYWFRKAAGHPLYQTLRTHLGESDFQYRQHPLLKSLVGNRNLAESLVDCVERADDQSTPILEEICWREWQILFLHQLS